MTLPLALRNRLAELILGAFDEPEARRTLEALGAFCESADGRLHPDASGRLASLGWFQAEEGGGLRLLGAHRAHRPTLCGRVEAALGALRDAAALPAAGTLSGLLARAGNLAGHGLFFEVHELLEPSWIRAEGDERLALQGLIQVAVALHHVQSGNREGAMSLLTEALTKLRAAGAALPLVTVAWEAELGTILAALREARALPPASPWPMPQTSNETALS